MIRIENQYNTLDEFDIKLTAILYLIVPRHIMQYCIYNNYGTAFEKNAMSGMFHIVYSTKCEVVLCEILSCCCELAI